MQVVTALAPRVLCGGPAWSDGGLGVPDGPEMCGFLPVDRILLPVPLSLSVDAVEPDVRLRS